MARYDEFFIVMKITFRNHVSPSIELFEVFKKKKVNHEMKQIFLDFGNENINNKMIRIKKGGSIIKILFQNGFQFIIEII